MKSQILLLALIAGALAFCGSRAEIRVGHGNDFPGATVTVPISYIARDSGIARIEGRLLFDDSLLTPSLDGCGGTLGEATVTCGVSGGVIDFVVESAVSPMPELPTGLVGSVDFTIDGGAPAPQRLALLLDGLAFFNGASSPVPDEGSMRGSVTILTEDTPSVQVGSVTAAGGTVRIPLTLDTKGIEITGINFSLAYDQSVFSEPACQVAPEQAMPGFSLFSCSASPGRVGLLYSQLSGFNDGPLAYLIIDLAGSVPGAYPIVYSPFLAPDAFDEDGQNRFLRVIDGQLEVLDAPEIEISRGGVIPDEADDDLGTLTFGRQVLTYTIQNLGVQDLTIGEVALTPSANLADVEIIMPPAAVVPPGESTELEISLDIVDGGPLSLGLAIVNNDLDENPYDITVIGDVTDSNPELAAELAQPLLLLDNDNDGDPNPSDTIRFEVLLRNGGETALGEVRFAFDAPEGTSIVTAGFDGSLGALSPMLDSDETSIAATFRNVPGGGATFSEIVSFDLLIDNDTTLSDISAQAIFTHGTAIIPTDDPSLPGENDPTEFALGRLSRLIADDTQQGFGQATALSGEFIAVGSPGDDGGAGTVAVYRVLPDGQREFVTRLSRPDGFAGQGFGTSVALDGRVLAIGSEDPVGARKGGTGAKAAIYELLANGTPSLVTQVRANLESAFGATVELDGDMLAVGAPGEAVGGVAGAGAVYTYSLASLAAGNDTPTTRIEPSAPANGARFGAAIGSRDGKMVIGAPGPVGGAVAGSAAIYDLLQRNLQPISAPIDAEGEFGASVAIAGQSIVIGAPSAQGGGGVFEFTPNGILVGNRINATDAAAGDDFGRSVSLAGDALFVGAPMSTVPGLLEAGRFGAVYRFDAQRNQVRKIGAFSDSGDTFRQQEGFGRSVVAEGEAILIGAPLSQDERGAAAFRRGAPLQQVFSDSFECTSLLGCESR